MALSIYIKRKTYKVRVSIPFYYNYKIDILNFGCVGKVLIMTSVIYKTQKFKDFSKRRKHKSTQFPSALRNN